ncbi:MAG: hypothetical protein KIT68_01910 [Phycisphaeraceae bacterium]|nr:hypothetical protein [Phycisphaeraceae bacterium]
MAARCRSLLTVLPVGLLGACAGPSQSPLLVEVQGGEGQPIVGAFVQCSPSNPRHPLRISDLFASDQEPGPWARTDADGRAIIQAFDEHPAAIVVIAPGFAAWQRHFDVHPSRTGGVWLPAEGAPAATATADGPRINVRFGKP